MKKGTLYTIGGVIILVISFIAFVLPASLGRGAAPKPLVFGEYNGRKIAYEQGSDFLNYVGRYSEQFRRNGQLDAQADYSIFYYAFNETVRQYAYEDAVKQSGYKVPVEAVNRIIRMSFSENGKFSEKLYRKADPAYIQSMKEELEETLFRMRYTEDLFGTSDDYFGTTPLFGLKKSDAEVEFLQNYGAELRGFDMVSFKKSEYPEEEKAKYAAANAAKFVKYDMSLITVEDKSTAETVANRIKNNEITFEDAITEYSSNNYTNTEGKLTNDFQYQIENILVNKEELATIVDLGVDSVSDPIETMAGYSLFKKNAANVQPDFEDVELMRKVSSYIIAYESTMIEDYFIAKAKDFTTEAMTTDTDTACASFNVAKTTLEPFALNYGSVSIANSVNTSIDGLATADENETFLKTAFGLKMNEYSEPVVMNDAVVVLQYTVSQEPETAEDDVSMIPYNMNQLDDVSANTAIMRSSKLKNDFINTYFNNMYKD